MNIAIIDDSEMDRQKLSDYIMRYCRTHTIFAELEQFCNGETFLAVFSRKDFDVIFLDIIMDGIDGMDTARRIRGHDASCLLIFTTTSQDFAVESFRVRAFDYLVKPFEYVQFEEVMDLCEAALLRYARYIEVKEGRENVRILLRDILYADYSNHYVQIHTKRRMIRTYIPFGEFSPMLLSQPQFLYCYRNCIVNLDEVASLDEKDFILHSGERVPIGRTLRPTVRQRYADYAFEKLEGLHR